jgi:hypothetical protein
VNDALPNVASELSRIGKLNVEKVSGMDRKKSVSNLQLFIVLHLLIVVTWLPPVILAYQKSALSDEATGTVIAFFPIGSNANENYHRIVHARGAFVGHALWQHGWIAYSYDPGFVRRLKQQGAWAVFDPIFLDPAALLGCGPLPAAEALPGHRQLDGKVGFQGTTGR